MPIVNFNVEKFSYAIENKIEGALMMIVADGKPRLPTIRDAEEYNAALAADDKIDAHKIGDNVIAWQAKNDYYFDIITPFEKVLKAEILVAQKTVDSLEIYPAIHYATNLAKDNSVSCHIEWYSKNEQGEFTLSAYCNKVLPNFVEQFRACLNGEKEIITVDLKELL